MLLLITIIVLIIKVVISEFTASEKGFVVFEYYGDPNFIPVM